MKTSLIVAVAVVGLCAARVGIAVPENTRVTQDASQANATEAVAPQALTFIDPPIWMAPFPVRAGVPTATHIMEPRIGPQYVGQSVELKFTVSKGGRAYNVEAANPLADRNLVEQLRSAIDGWQFDPARDTSGAAVERTVILPVVIVEPAYGSNGEVLPLLGSVPDEKPIKMAPYHVRTNLSVPAAIDVVAPRIGAEFGNQKVELRFTIDKTGRPYNIEAITPNVDRNLVSQLAGAVWHWRFDPARDAQGRPVERNVILPMAIGAAK